MGNRGRIGTEDQWYSDVTQEKLLDRMLAAARKLFIEHEPKGRLSELQRQSGSIFYEEIKSAVESDALLKIEEGNVKEHQVAIHAQRFATALRDFPDDREEILNDIRKEQGDVFLQSVLFIYENLPENVPKPVQISDSQSATKNRESVQEPLTDLVLLKFLEKDMENSNGQACLESIERIGNKIKELREIYSGVLVVSSPGVCVGRSALDTNRQDDENADRKSMYASVGYHQLITELKSYIQPFVPGTRVVTMKDFDEENITATSELLNNLISDERMILFITHNWATTRDSFESDVDHEKLVDAVCRAVKVDEVQRYKT